MNFEVWKMAWKMLSTRERRLAIMVLFVAILGAGAQVLMIGSIMPFLSFVSDRSALEEQRLLRAAYDHLGFESRYAFAVVLGLSAIAIILLSNLVLLMRSYMISRFSVMRVHMISTRLLKSYLGRPYEYFLSRNSADIGKRILSETYEIAWSFLHPAADMIASALSAFFILAFLLYLEPAGTAVGVSCVLALYLGIYRFSGRYLARIGQQRVEANERRYLSISEIFGGIKDVKVHRKEDVYIKRFEEASRQMLQANWKSRIAADTPQYLVQAFFFSAVIAACLIMIDPSAFDANGEAISGMVPLLGVFAFAGQRIVPEIQKIYAASSKIAYGAATLKNVYEDMSFDGRQSPAEGSDLEFSDTIELRDISYHYPGAKAGISKLTITIRKGERIGLVGGTGAGKTTLVDILLGLLKPEEGEIRIDGKPLATASDLDAWRSKIGYVPQTIFLADASFAENIAFGVPASDIDQDKVERCAKIAQIHDFIVNETPNGYRSMTGERGMMLSGGQRQRIGIARALYRDAELIVFDEATSALDPRTEREVMAAIDSLPKNITLVMIAHRLGTLRNSDRLLVLEKGHLVESGTWDDLIAGKGAFFQLTENYNS